MVMTSFKFHMRTLTPKRLGIEEAVPRTVLVGTRTQ